jgi:large-conductance mechanosensitive channel
MIISPGYILIPTVSLRPKLKVSNISLDGKPSSESADKKITGSNKMFIKTNTFLEKILNFIIITP